VGVKKKLLKRLKLVRHLLEDSRYYGISPAATLRRFWRLYHQLKLSPEEIFLNGLLSPDIPEDRLAYYLSREYQVALESRLVPRSYHCLTSDKAVFYAYCKAAGLPIPALYAVFDQPAGWTADGRPLGREEEWIGFLHDLPEQFIVKPALGLIGQGVQAFSRQDGHFLDHRGTAYQAEDVYGVLQSLGGKNYFATGLWSHGLGLAHRSHKGIIQERLFAHPDIVKITGNRSISTYRLTTLILDNELLLLYGLFRIARKGNISDNFSKGQSGNLWISVDCATGKIQSAHMLAPGDKRFITTDYYEETAMTLPGTALPHWDEAVALAREAAWKFYPQPMIAWDIGITEQGARLIEGNLGWAVLPSPLEHRVRDLLQRARIL
tara:strand:+ start:17436 stop:18572 length:1137 start_codon:yes stop_codon:yes gene_type:complete